MTKLDADPGNQVTLDENAIARLRQDMGEDLGMVIEAYVESIDELLSDIANRTVRTPAQDLHRWAHSLKSSAASIGAMRLAHLAAEMENAYMDRQRIDVAAQLESMQCEYQRVSDGLQKINLD